MQVEFSKNKDAAAIAADRYETMFPNIEGYDRLALIMDLCAADGENGNNPIDWDRLNAADDFNFMHDVCGITDCMDRKTGKLGRFFSPRFSRSAIAA